MKHRINECTGLRCLSFSQSSSLLAAGGSNNVVVWDVESGKKVHSLVSPIGSSNIEAIKWAINNLLLISCHADNCVLLWNIQEEKVVAALRIPEFPS